MKTNRFLWALLVCAACGAIAAAAPVGVVAINGTISPATSGYLRRALDRADERQLECLIIELDTPGGLLDSTKEIVQTFYRARTPVVVYVAPAGASAASAGCFITLAADLAAMAPDTTIGAAHPVELSPGGGASDATMTKKIESFAASYIEAIAERRHRNIEWAKSAVRESASITAAKALETQVIDLVARDLPDLLRQLDGREVHGRVLRTAGAEVEDIPMIAREKVFQLLWRPEVLFVLMLVAIYGIIGELSNPGAVLPGVVGGIALIVAFYMGAILPINIAGVALIALAVGLFILDIFAPTHGVLTVGGAISFLLGSLLLFERAGPAFQLSLGMILPATVVTLLFFTGIVGAGLRAQRLPVRTGREALIGRTGAAIAPISSAAGKVFVDGELWEARCEIPIETGKPVEIATVRGLILQVKPKT
jgi:membrane-bound serine protease (ClpP class)